MNTQPKAIKFAKILAVELRRLHEVNQLMLEALIATREAHTLMEQLRALDLRDAAIAKATGVTE